MTPQLLGRLTLVAALGLIVLPSPAQEEGGSLREIRVQEIIASCAEAPIPTIWQRAEELAKLGSAAKRPIQRALKDATVGGKLCGLKALIALDSPTYAAEKLMDLAADEDLKLEQRLAALELVGLTDEIDVEDGLLELLIAFNPQIRIAAARALWRLESDRSHEAKKTLREFLKSADADLRAEGAIALAEMGDGETALVRATLLQLRKEPGPRGKLADALYRNLQLQRTINLLDARRDASSAKQARNSPWAHLDEIRKRLKIAYDLPEGADDAEMRERAARGLLDIAADPHTTFMTPEQYGEFLHGDSGVDPSYGGIGAFIDTNVKDRMRILRPIFNGPAWKANIIGGDDIMAVDGVPTSGRSTTDIIKQIKGKPGTPVILSIFREGWGETRDVKVIRAKITLPTVYSRMLPGNIAYVQIAQFAYVTGDELRQHLTKLEAAGAKGLVIDLRDNPGGLLGTVIECLTLFLRDRELVATSKGRMFPKREYRSGRSDARRSYPISVLVNERSASGAELMSGVLQYYSKTSDLAGAERPYLDAIVFGRETFGKGSMQQTMALDSWPGEEFVDLPKKNGMYDWGEEFKDRNGNRRWDPGEPFQDKARPNGRWDPAEDFVDQNGNGKHDAGEPFTDENGDGIWNDAEQFTDKNGNGQYDHGAAIKLTVARYYLPGGKNFTRTRVWDETKKAYVYKGGVEPDKKVEPERMELSNLVEFRALQEKNGFGEYVESRWDEHKELFKKLAFTDGRDPGRYPDFDAFYGELRTRLSKQEVRRGLRLAIRRRVSVDRLEEIHGDLSDDNVLRVGVFDVLRRLGTDPATIEEYRGLVAAATK